MSSSIQSIRPSSATPLKNEAGSSSVGNRNSFVRENRDAMGAHASQRIESPERLELREATQSIVDSFQRSGRKPMSFPYNGALGYISEGFGGVLMSLPLNSGGKEMLELHINGMGHVGSRPKVSDGEMTAILKLASMSMQWKFFAR